MASKDGRAYYVFINHCSRMLDEIDRKTRAKYDRERRHEREDEDLPDYDDRNDTGRVWSF